MENQNLVLAFKNSETEFSFENRAIYVQDKELIENLSKPNIKNKDSALFIKSLNNIHISDVIQIKVNIASTGYLLISFNKDFFDDKKRNELLKDITLHKSNETPTLETQIKKIEDLVNVLNKYAPIYASFANTGSIKLDISNFENLSVVFPLLVLEQPEVAPTAEQSSESAEKNTRRNEKGFERFPLFDVDYIFALIFALLGSFAIAAAVFELMNKEGIAAFLIVLGVVFAVTLLLAVHSTVYRKTELRNPWLRYYLGIFILVGIVGGTIAGYIICQRVLKTEIEDFNYKKMLITSVPISVVALLSSIETCRLVNLVAKFIQKKKSQ